MDTITSLVGGRRMTQRMVW